MVMIFILNTQVRQVVALPYTSDQIWTIIKENLSILDDDFETIWVER